MMLKLLNILGQATPPPSPVAPGESDGLWMPPPASTVAHEVDAVFYFIYWISVFFFILIVALMVWFAIRYRQRRPGQVGTGKTTHHTGLELTWTIIPLILVIIMFYMGFRGYVDMSTPPANATDIYVNARKWSWSFTYPNGHIDNELHVRAGYPVRLILTSADVIHSFFVPAFRIKKDAVPGRYNKAWFQCDEPGEYLVLCTEYCGTDHSNMWARVIVHEPGGYEAWMAAASDPFTKDGQPVPMAEVGQKLFTKFACNTCHGADGSGGQGPKLIGAFGHNVEFADGSTAVVDEDYIRESVLVPAAKIVKGYGNIMPSYRGQIKDREITALIEFIKSLEQ